MGACSPASWELSVISSNCCVNRLRGSGSPAPWELTSQHRTVVAAGSVGAGSLAPCELALYRRTTVVVSAGSLAAGSLAPWELSSYLRTVVEGAGSPAPCKRCQHQLPLIRHYCYRRLRLVPSPADPVVLGARSDRFQEVSPRPSLS